MNRIIESGLLWPLLAALALLVAIFVIVVTLAGSIGRRAKAAPPAGERSRVEPHLYASRTGGGGLPVVYRQDAGPTSALPPPRRRGGFGWLALAVAFALGGGAGVVTGGIAGAPGWETYEPYVQRALAEADAARRQVMVMAAAGMARLSDALAGDPPEDTVAATPTRTVEVVGDNVDPPAGSEPDEAVVAFVRAMDGELPLAVSPAIDLIAAHARNGNLALTMQVKRVVRERDRSLFVLTANERTRDLICNDTETVAIRALSDANVGIAITYVDASSETIFEIDVLGRHCANG